MRRGLVSAAAALALAFGGAAIPASGKPAAVVAKSCRAGYVHAVIGGQQKCLREGEFCAHRYQRQYKRYGFDCTHTDRRGHYHLT